MQTTFPLKQIRKLLKTARDRFDPVDIHIDDHFAITYASPDFLLPTFDKLRLKPGWSLIAHRFAPGHGPVYAYPTNRPLPEFYDGLIEDPWSTWEPEAPAQAQPPMTAITGPGTPLSFLQASLLARELGAVIDGWDAHELYGGEPLSPDWTWHASRPGSYNPTITRDDLGTAVSFYSRSYHDIFLHCDTYPANGGYWCTPHITTIASRPKSQPETAGHA